MVKIICCHGRRNLVKANTLCQIRRRFFPVILTPSTVGELTEITIESDQNVTPVWRITGPVTDVKVTHQESGAFFQVRETFKPGEWMVLDVATYDVF